MTDQPAVGPYGSVRDLPSVQEIEQKILAFKLIGLLLPKQQRIELKQLEQEHRRITGLVDSFYELLGRRNWVFSGDLNSSAIEIVVNSGDPATAEARLIGYYQESGRIKAQLLRLHRFAAMRPRIDLLHKALVDYEAGRYYSTVLVLLAVMDGFVNDLDTSARRSLHARAVEDMVAWDSVTGHHLGLSHAHQTFLKGFRKTDTADVSELFRNGIVHGMLVNFDNEVVATKAWNRLFAVADWADSRERRAKPVEPVPTLRESFRRWRDVQEEKARIADWQPYEYQPHPAVEDLSEVGGICRDFLERWQRRQWGLVGAHFMEPGRTRSPIGTLAVLAKDLYAPLDLSVWTILRVRHVGAAVAHTDVELLVNGNTHRTDLRWVRVDDSGSTATEWQPGRWLLSQYGPSFFLKSDTVIERSTESDETHAAD